MELKEGYKNTDIGVLPEEWNPKSYGDIFQFLSTASFSREQLSDDEEIKCVHYGDIHTKLNHSIDFQEGYSSSIDYEKGKRYPFLKDGDIIMADASEDYSGVGKSVEVKNLGNQMAISGLHTILLRDKNNEFVDGFRGYIHTIHPVKKSLDRLATGLKVYSVSKGNLKTILIPVPPKPEQQAIATALSDIDTLITNLDKLIAKKKAIKQGAMQQLLKAPDKGGKRLPGFEGKWISDKVENIMKVYRGGSPRPIQAYLTESANGINWIKIGDTDKFGKYIKSSEERIIPEGQNFSRNVYIGDFLLSNSMSFGRPYILKIDGCIHDGWLVLQNYQSSLDTEFLYYLLISREVHNQYLSKAAGSGVLNLNKELVKSVELTFPKSLEEQKSIASVFCDMDTEIESLESKKSKYLLIKQGMMQELLTGKTRLI
jgi:type I restriction enzyme S subunit